jgi:hypothetical protein
MVMSSMVEDAGGEQVATTRPARSPRRRWIHAITIAPIRKPGSRPRSWQADAQALRGLEPSEIVILHPSDQVDDGVRVVSH